VPDKIFASEKAKLPLHAAKIEDYALIGDCETAALVSRAGSIDWLCWPTFSNAACFAALLGTVDHGFWKIAPVQRLESTHRRYLGNTLIVETTFITSSGSVVLVDFMPPRGHNSDIVRIVRGIGGKVKMKMELAIRFDYGRTIPWVTHTDFGLRAIAGPDMVILRTPATSFLSPSPTAPPWARTATPPLSIPSRFPRSRHSTRPSNSGRIG
jgi:GH15 family glucan-1,4-alpha-glucosidase